MEKEKYNLSAQEAIDAIRSNYPPANYTILREALDMAIQALNGENKNDKNI